MNLTSKITGFSKYNTPKILNAKKSQLAISLDPIDDTQYDDKDRSVKSRNNLVNLF